MILVGNWKNYPNTKEEAKEILKSLSRKAKVFKKLHTFIAPPVVFLDVVGERVGNIGGLASQDIFEHTGTYTGALSISMLKNFGVKVSIVGHSERRKLGESNLGVSNKVKTALKAGIIPILCVGEEVHDNDGGYFEFLSEQIKESLQGIRKSQDAKNIIIAYEPVWAIGKEAKGAMEPKELEQMVIFIKKVLADLFGRKVADSIAILYGGSVDGDNAKSLSKGTGIKGFLVGRASLEPKTFSSIALALTK